MEKPKIRFKGYQEDWEQRKLGDITVKIGSGKTPSGGKSAYVETGIPLIRSQNVNGDKVDFADIVFIDEATDESMANSRVYTNDVLLNITGASIGRSAVYKGLESANVNQHVCIIRPTEGYQPDFIQLNLSSDNGQKQIDASQAGGGREGLNFQEIGKIQFYFPSLNEQKCIGRYFNSLDHLITLHQRKCEEMKTLKKYMLQKMFPQNGQSVPQIRFSGFTEDWEQRKLGDWGDFYYGRSCPKWSVTEDATIPCIRYGELYTKFGAKIDRVYSYTNMPPENLRFSKGTEVLIPRVGEDPMDYNHCTWLSMQGVAIGEMISVFNTDNNPLFTATMFNATLQNEFAMRVEGGSVTNLYFEKLKNIDVSFPSIPEQEKIAAYFESLDHFITLHQQKCDELRNIKKFMLQNMFI